MKAASAVLARPFVRFLIVGGICFTSVLVTFAALHRLVPLPLAATVSYAVGACISYELNGSWTFGLSSRSYAQIGRFVAITAAAMSVNAGLLQAVVSWFAAPALAAEILTLACLAPLTFMAYGRWGFTERRTPRSG